MRVLLLLSLLSSGAIAADLPAPPVAAKRAHEVRAPFGAVRNDEYYWLRDDTRKNPEMLDYLKAENGYTDAMVAPLKPLQDRLYREITSRIKQDDSSVPYAQDGYYYYSRFTPRRRLSDHRSQEGLAGGQRANIARRTGDGQGQRLFCGVGV